MLFVVGLLGLCIGSFLNVCIYRIAREESVSFPPSHCTNCGYNLKPKDLIPVFSYIFLMGKCRKCKEIISIKYPIIEVINAGFYIMLFLRYGLTMDFIKFCVLISLLLVIGMIDYETKFVYKSTIIFGIISGFIFIVLEKIVNNGEIAQYIIGGILGICIIAFIVFTTKGMGEGDIEIAGICGLFLGWKGIVLTLFLAFVLGGIYGVYVLITGKKGRKSEIAFGPFLVIGAIITIFLGVYLIRKYIEILIY